MHGLKKYINNNKILDEYEKIDYNNQAFFEVRVLWPNSSVWLERQPVTLEVAGSSPVRFATLFRKNSRLRAAFLHSDFYCSCIPSAVSRKPSGRTAFF